MLQLPEATLILDGTRVADNLVAQGRSVLRKTGVGALELRNGVAQSDDGIEVTGGVLRLNTGLVEGTLAVSNATLESSSGEVDQLVIRSATVRLLRTPQAFTTLVVSNVSFDAASTLQLRFDNAGGGLPSGPAIDLEASGVADLGNATLDVQIDSVSNLGDKLVVLRNSGSNAVVGTFRQPARRQRARRGRPALAHQLHRRTHGP